MVSNPASSTAQKMHDMWCTYPLVEARASFLLLNAQSALDLLNWEWRYTPIYLVLQNLIFQKSINILIIIRQTIQYTEILASNQFLTVQFFR